jgi:hypothetical protein
MTICNSLYFLHRINVIEQVAWVARNVTHHIYNHILVQLIAIQLQLCRNSFSTIKQLPPYDYNHNVMSMSFFIHSSNFNMWHMKIF